MAVGPNAEAWHERSDIKPVRAPFGASWKPRHECAWTR
jgi:hypothetical protein